MFASKTELKNKLIIFTIENYFEFKMNNMTKTDMKFVVLIKIAKGILMPRKYPSKNVR